jgi:carbon storage regulator
MLVLSRKTGQSILVGDGIEITVVRVEGDQVRLGIAAPKEVPILRKELLEEIRSETAAAKRERKDLASTDALRQLSLKLRPTKTIS